MNSQEICDIFKKLNKNCSECMKDTPYEYCCRLECGEHEFCKNCSWENDFKKST